jgi:polar amino acid transport system substrate-binding protein
MRGGGVAEEIARTNFPQATLKTFDNERQAFDALEAGTVTGVLTFSPRTNFEMARAPDKFARGTTGRLLPQTVEAFAVRKGEPSLREFLTAWIYYNEAAGWLAERHHEWFDSLDWVVRLQQ